MENESTLISVCRPHSQAICGTRSRRLRRQRPRIYHRPIVSSDGQSQSLLCLCGPVRTRAGGGAVGRYLARAGRPAGPVTRSTSRETTQIERESRDLQVPVTNSATDNDDDDGLE